MLQDSDSSDSDLEMALYDSLFFKKKTSTRRLNLEDVSDTCCEEMFRYKGPFKPDQHRPTLLV